MLRYPRTGDEVRTTKTLTTSLWGGRIRPGARAVVLSVGVLNATVKLDTGNGFTTAVVPTTSLRVVRRSVGEDRFTQRANVIHLARLGVAIVMLAPFATFTIRYVAATGTTDGLLETIVAGMLQSALDLIALALLNPLGTATYVLIGWALWRFAFPK